MTELTDRERELPPELPPVEPPSAGFLVQLFVVPGVIVMVIVGVWLLVTRLAQSEQDWRTLLADVQSPHEHLRWRGAFGLAQMLQADEKLAGNAPRLVQNPEVARQLSELLTSELKRGSQKENDILRQAFLARTLGLFALPDVVLPALREALRFEHDLEVRKNALGAIAVLAGRALEGGPAVADEATLDAVVLASREGEVLIRQLATFTLGLLPADAATQRLQVLLEDADAGIRANAVVGLARKKSLACLPVLETILAESQVPAEPQSDAEYQQFLTVKNAVQALDLLSPQLTAAQRARLIPLLQPLSDGFREPRIRLNARQLLFKLKGA